MKRYISLWLVCLLAVFSMTARAQEGIETKARPDFPALPFTLNYTAPEHAASFSLSANGTTLLASPTTLHAGTQVKLTTAPAAGYQMAFGYPKVYRTGTPATTVPVMPVSGSNNAYTFTMPSYPATVEARYEKIPHPITFATPANGTLALSAAGTPLASGAKLAPGTVVTITAVPAAGYRMASGYPKARVTDSNIYEVEVRPVSGRDNTYTFTVPDFQIAGITVVVQYEKIPYAVSFTAPANGTLALDTAGTKLASGAKLIPGTQVTLTAVPDAGYQMVSGYPKVKPYNGPEAPLQATPVDGRDNTYTFTMPDYSVEVEVKYEKIPQAVTFADPANGTLALSVNGNPLTSGDKLAFFKEVTITATPDEGCQMVFGSLKVFGNDEIGKEIIVPLEKGNGATCFLMPAFEVKVEVRFERSPAAQSSETRLSSLSYQVGGETAKSIPGFLASTIAYDVVLPSTTSRSATLTLSGQPVDMKATVAPTAATVQLVDGKAKATLVVTAEDGQAKRTYAVNFTVAPQPVCYVTIQQPEGGTISVSYKKEGKEVVVKSGDAVPQNIELNLANTALQNYEFKEYSVDGSSQTAETVNIGTCLSKTITAAFTQESSVPPEEAATIGTPAVPKEKNGQDMNVPTDDNPIVIIPDAVSLPSDTELSSLRLVKEDIEDSEKKAEIEEKAEAAAQDAGIAPDAPKIVMEVTLVKVTTKISSDNETTTTAVTPVQPSDIVTVRIPYPEGVNRDQHNIVIIHLRSDGVVDVYSEAKGNLILKEDYMEISVASFSPFVVSYTPKSGPVDPGYPDKPDTPDTPDTPTSNASVEGGMAVWTSANALHIRADRPAEAWVVGLSGASRARFAVVPGETRYALPAGVYLVRIADQTYKVRIRN